MFAAFPIGRVESQGDDALRADDKARRPVYYGWWVLAATAAIEMLTIGSTSYSAGLFVLPLEQEFSLSRAAANSPLAISFIGAALMAPLAGYLLDRYSARKVIAIGAIAFGLSFVFIATSSSLPLMALALAIPAGFGGMAIGPLTTTALTSRWFYRRRGRTLGIAAVATSGGGIVVVPLLAWAVEHYGWRTALFGEAVSILLIVLVLAVFVVRDGPSDLGLEDHPENWGRPAWDMRAGAPNAQRWRYGAILRTLNFWAVGVVFTVTTAYAQALVVTLVPYGTELGFSSASASLLISAFSVSAAITKIGSGYVADFADRRLILIAATLALVLSAGSLLMFSDYVTLVVASSLAGIALGGVLPSAAALVGGHFGTPSFGKVMGMLYFAAVGGSVAAVYFIGRAFDTTHSYGPAFAAFLGISVATLVAALLVRATATNQAATVLPEKSLKTVGSGSPR
jgi:MFS family permease